MKAGEASTVYRSVEPLVRPRSITLVGASERPDSWPARIFKNLRRYQFPGDVFLVNPRHRELYGTACFPSVSDVPHEIDQLVVIVPAQHVPGILEQAAERGCRSAVVFSGGFAETNTAKGKGLQDALFSAADRCGIAIGGPNCLGNVSTRERVLTLAEQRVELFRPGGLGLISQSSGLMGGVSQYAHSRGLGLSYAMASGGEANRDAADYLDFLVNDDPTRVIGLILETIRRPREFANACSRALTAGKPILVLKIGRSKEGRAATLTHTGALSGAYEAFLAFCRRHKLIVVKGFDELVDTAELFLRGSIPRVAGLAAISSSGGGRGYICDLAEELALEFPPLAPEATQRLEKLLGVGSGVGNPVDIGAGGASNPDVYLHCLEILGSEPAVGMIAVQGELPHSEESARRAAGFQKMAERAAEMGKVLVFFSRAPYAVSQYGAQFQDTCPAPFLQEMRRSFQAIVHLVNYCRFRRSEMASIRKEGLPRYGSQKSFTPLPGCSPENVAFALLTEFGMPVARFETCDSLEQAESAAERIGYPVALKVSVPGLTHKTEVDGVWVGLASRADLLRAFKAAQEKMSSLGASGSVLVQEMVKGELELYIGGRWDPEFGPIVTMGFGGLLVEAVGRNSSRLAPLNAAEVEEMLIESGVIQAVERLKGDSELICSLIADSVSRFSRLIAGHEQIETLEVNPLIVKRTGSCVAVDVVAITKL